MSPLAIALSTTALVFLSGVVGSRIGRLLPPHHLSPDSKDVVKFGAGFIGTLSALVLGLLVASAKSSYDAKYSEVEQAAARIIALDRALRDFGPPAEPLHLQLRKLVEERHSVTWIAHQALEAPAASADGRTGAERLRAGIAALVPGNDEQRTLKARMLEMLDAFIQIRWLFVAQMADSMSMPLLVVLVSWLAAISLCTGLYSPGNATVAVVGLLCAASAGAAIFLIAEMYQPFSGVMRISDAPMQTALRYLER